MPPTRKTRKKTHVDELAPSKGRLELKLKESKNVGMKSGKAAKAAEVIEKVTGENSTKRSTRGSQRAMENVMAVQIVEEVPRGKQVEHSIEMIENQTVKISKVQTAKPRRDAKCVTPNEDASGSTMKRRKRKAVEAPEEAQEQEKKLVIPAVVIAVPRKDTTRSRKRTKTLTETEDEANGSAANAPQKSSKTKSKTPRVTRNATLLSIAASSLGQTTLSAPPALTISQNTAPTDEPPTTTRETTVAISTLNTILTASTKLGENASKAKRPAYLTHIINLHSHLLTAIHLHRAQNGITSSPIFASLRPHLERLSKRAVELADLRKICWISGFDLNGLVAPAKVDVEVENGQGRKRRRKEKGTQKSLTKSKEEDDDKLKVPKGWLKIVDYGNGRVAVELVMSMAKVGEVNHLRREFETRVDTLWAAGQLSVKSKEGEEQGQGQVLEFEIPMVEILVSENKKLVDTVLKAKGQQRLSDMKGIGVIRGKVHEEKSISSGKKFLSPTPAPASASILVHNPPNPTPTPVEVYEKDSQPTEDFANASITTTTTTTTSSSSAVTAISPTPNPNPAPPPIHPGTCPPPTTSTEVKKLSLLDRIRAKHQATLLQASTSPTANLSPEEARLAHLRLCAQQRLPEVTPILRALRLRASGGGIGGVGVGGGKRSLSLGEAVTAVRQSMRGSISWDEAEMCIRLAGEMGAAVASSENVRTAGKITKSALTTNTAANTTNTASAGEKGGKGNLLSKWGESGTIGGANRDEKTSWVEVVECGGLKAVVFK